MSKFPNPVWLRSFESASRHMSFTLAAAELGITQTALSLHVRSLEKALECKLFLRAARNLTLTDMGQAYAFSVRRAFGDISLATTSLFGSDNSVTLTVRVPISSAVPWLTSRLPEFTRLHPDISIRLVSNIWAESMAQENIDVDLRLGNGEWAPSAARKISEEKIVPIAARPDKQGDLIVGDLAKGPFVQILGFENFWHRYLDAHQLEPAKEVAAFAVDTTIAAIDIVAAGGGYAVVLERFAISSIATGKEIAIVGKAVDIAQSHYLIENTSHGKNDTARKIFELWLEDLFK